MALRGRSLLAAWAILSSCSDGGSFRAGQGSGGGGGSNIGDEGGEAGAVVGGASDGGGGGSSGSSAAGEGGVMMGSGGSPPELGGSAGSAGDSSVVAAGAGGTAVSDPCDPNPCQNGGTCTASDGRAACSCTTRYTGESCQFQRFRGVGTLAGDDLSDLIAVSRDGTTVAGISFPRSGMPYHTFRSVNGEALQYIEPPAGATTTYGCFPTGIDQTGDLVVGGCDNVGFRFTPTNGTEEADQFLSGGIGLNALSADGSTLVGEAFSSLEAFRRTPTDTTLLGKLEPDANAESAALAVNGDGSVVAGVDVSSLGEHAFRWTSQTGMIQLAEMVEWGNHEALDVSTDGNVIVGWARVGSVERAVRWTGTTAPGYLSAETSNARALATNADGSITVGSEQTQAVIWDISGESTVASLLASSSDLAGWTLTQAVDVSDDGKVIVGQGTHDGQREGWVAHLP